MVKSESIGLNSKGREGYTTYWAAYHGLVEVVRALATAGADINKADNDGWTPLITASYMDHLPAVQYYRSHGGRELPRECRSHCLVLPSVHVPVPCL